MKGLEPPRLTTLDPKSSAATNYATSAFGAANIHESLTLQKYFCENIFYFASHTFIPQLTQQFIMISLDPKELSPMEVQNHLQHAIAPRPIALVSTISHQGDINLSPFSFFNIFSSNPPIVIFSPARRVRNNTTKDTLENVIQTREAVVNVVNFDLVQQTSLSSTEYPTGVNEFVKAGLTPIASDIVKAPRVAESPVQLECKVNDVVPLGSEGGAGNLVIAEVVRIHMHPNILNEQGKIDQHKIDLVARLGGNWYARASGQALFEVEKPLATLGIGVDAIPKIIKESNVFTGNHLGMLGNVETLPTAEEIQQSLQSAEYLQLKNQAPDAYELRELIYHSAKELLEKGETRKAWALLLCDELTKKSTHGTGRKD